MVLKALSGLFFAILWISPLAQAGVRALGFSRPHVGGEMIVTFKQSFSPFAVTRFAAEHEIEVIKGFSSSPSYLVRLNGDMDEKSLQQRAKELLGESAVVSVEANTIYHLFGQSPNDTDFAKQWGLANSGQGGGKAGADISALAAWDVSHGSKNILVGIIDTGIDYTHPELVANIWHNPGESGLDAQGRDKSSNGIDDDNNGYIDDYMGWDFINKDNDPMDDHNHGSHVAGVIGGRGNNGVGIAGINWDVSMVPIKVFDSAGSSSLDVLVEAIEYSTKIGVRVTNNSWGGAGYSDLLEAAIRQARDNGILFIAAAGNEAQNTDIHLNYPSCYNLDNIISVAASSRHDKISSFSNYGKETVDVAAPGEDIYSTVTQGGYLEMSGTSMATPHVVGLAALIMSVYPDIDYTAVKNRILGSVDPIPELVSRTRTGGRINASRSLEVDNIAPSAPSAITVVGGGISSFSATFAQSGDDGMDGIATAYEVRLSAAPIQTDNEWNQARKVNGIFTKSKSDSSLIQVRVEGLALNEAGYLALRAFDNVGNISVLSATVPYALMATQMIYQNNANNLDGVVAQKDWGIEKIGNESVFSDSPNKKYENGRNASLTFPAMSVTTERVYLQYQIQYDLESGYDFGFLEISTDKGVTWKKVREYDGAAGWRLEQVDLSTVLDGAKGFQLRFRIQTDNSLARDGIKIDNVTVLVPK